MTFNDLRLQQGLPEEDSVDLSGDEEVAMEHLRIGWNAATQNALDAIESEIEKLKRDDPEITTITSLMIRSLRVAKSAIEEDKT